MTNKEPIRLNIVGEKGAGLAVEFVWSQDRYAHRLLYLSPTDEQVLLHSREGDPKEGWPSSPPIQQLRRHVSTPDREVLLGLGMAGNSHWSLSVESMNSPPTLLFDVACRLRGPYAWLGSTYEFDADRLQPHFQIHSAHVLPNVHIGCQGSDAENRVSIVGSHETPSLEVRLEPTTQRSEQRTLRWQYHVVRTATHE